MYLPAFSAVRTRVRVHLGEVPPIFLNGTFCLEIMVDVRAVVRHNTRTLFPLSLNGNILRNYSITTRTYHGLRHLTVQSGYACGVQLVLITLL